MSLLKIGFFSILILIGLFNRLQANPDTVYRIKIEGTIDLGLSHYVSRAITEANNQAGKAILLEINTFGGRVDAATQIRDAIYQSRIPVVAFIHTRAWSAGALIALACPHIIMSDGSSIGAAEPIPTTPKTISAIEGEFRSEAERYQRDSDIAGGMVNPNVEIKGLKRKGEILTLTFNQAVKYHFAEKILNSEQEVLAFYHWDHATLSDLSLTRSERLTRFITGPDVSAILLTIGILGIQIEIITQHAIAGIFGLIALGLFFGGHLIANVSDTWFVLLFVLGIGLLLFELHVLPGHGISGILGVCSILLSFFFVLGGNGSALREEALSLGASTAIFLLLLRFLPKAPLFRKLILETAPVAIATSLKEVPHELESLIGKTGSAVSDLRPSGIVIIENKRYSASTEGGYLPAGAKIIVSSYQGSTLTVNKAD